MLSEEKLQAEIKRLRNPEVLKLKQVKDYCTWLDRRRKLRKPGRVVGDTGLGKTSASIFYAFQNRAQKRPNSHPRIPVLYIELTGSSCSSSVLFDRIATSLKPKVLSGSVNQQRKIVWNYLQQSKVEMLIIDEAHRLQFQALDDVRDLEKNAGVLPILVGTSTRLDTLISKNEQVISRFACHFNFERLEGGNFEKAVRAWEEDILKLPEPSNMDKDPEIITLLQEKTRGQIRLLDQILRDAAVFALEKGKSKVDLGVLKEVEGDYYLVGA
jgi:DNA transposition AAA+ family ATPase